MSNLIANTLFSNTRTMILSKLLISPDKWWYHSDLAKQLGIRPSSLQRELASLTEAEILLSRKDGNRMYYSANIACPIFKELQGIFVKTYGIRDIVEEILAGHKKKIEFSFIYGSIARGEEIAISDVDVMIVGDVTLKEMSKKLNKIEDKVQREINPTVYSSEEFLDLLGENHFINEVVEGEKIFLVGTDEEFEEFIGQG